MVPPGKLAPTGHAVVFMTDPTGDACWAFDVNEPDAVYICGDFVDGPEPGWLREPEDLQEFLVHNAVNEAASLANAYQYCTDLPEGLLDEVLSPVTEVAFDGWEWPVPGGRVFMSESLIAEVSPALGRTAPFET